MLLQRSGFLISDTPRKARASSIEFPYHGMLSHQWPRAAGPPTTSWDLQEPDSRFRWWLSQGFCHSHRKLKNMIGWVKINYHLVRSDSRSSERNESNEFRFRFSDIGSYSFNTVRYDTYVWHKLNMQKCKMQEVHWDVCVEHSHRDNLWDDLSREQGKNPGGVWEKKGFGYLSSTLYPDSSNPMKVYLLRSYGSFLSLFWPAQNVLIH